MWARLLRVRARVAPLLRRTVARRLRIIAIVGSFGKSTTMKAVTTSLGGVRWWMSHRIAVNYFSPWILRSWLPGRRPPRDRYLAIECGIDRPGQMATHARMVRPDIAVVTSIGSEHNRSLGTIETTRDEKANMVRALSPAGVAVLNGDDPNVMWMRDQTAAKVITFGFGEANDVRATDVSLEDWPDGTRFTLHANGESHAMRVRLIGRTSLYPILAGAAVALEEGLAFDEIRPRLESIRPVPGRFEPVPLDNGAVILRDDFKSPMETIHAALDVLAEIPARRRIVVLGEISEPQGSQGPLYRALGERVAEIADRAIFIAGRWAYAYAAGAKRAGMPDAAITRARHDVFKAIPVLQDELGAGDVVLIKGRDTQRLDRITLALQGRTIRCRIQFCRTKVARCYACPMLERGWDQDSPTT